VCVIHWVPAAVTTEQAKPLFEQAVAGAELMLRLDTRLPSLPVGRGTAFFLAGACFHRREAIEELEILVHGTPHRPAASRMPRLDLFRMAHPRLKVGSDDRRGDACSAEDPEGRCYRSGFWATIQVDAQDRPGPVELHVAVRLESGAKVIAPLGRVEIIERRKPMFYRGVRERRRAGLIAVCMATFEPEMTLFKTQIDSLRAQTDRDWMCLISDDCSSPERFDEIADTVAGDSRFAVSRSPRHLGYYRNFERALEMAPSDADLVALCDQDDRWYRDKLAVLRDALGSAQLVYSDQRLVDADGRVLRDTLWTGRRNNHTNLASLLIANSVTGAATLFRREVAELMLPFPDPPGWQFHDHWLGLVAMAMGEIAYVDRPLYDYVQHPGAILGQVVDSDASAKARKRGRPDLERLRDSLHGWRAAYFYGYLAREVLAQALLARCSATLPAAKRRVLERLIAAAHAPLPFAWLASRPLRGLAGANETLATELELVRGIMWRYLIEVRTRRSEVPGAAAYDASCPPLDVDTLGESRLARWRAGT
jgi:glycosyltransferase involved in cell wall biosynthesis